MTQLPKQKLLQYLQLCDYFFRSAMFETAEGRQQRPGPVENLPN